MVFLCSQCDALVRIDEVPPGCGVRCPRCGAVHDLRGTGPHDTYALRPPPGGWLPPEPYKPVQPRGGRSTRFGSELSRGVGLGFGWLVGAALAVLCCVIAIVVLQRSAGPVADWFNRQQAQWKRSEEVARQKGAAPAAQPPDESSAPAPAPAVEPPSAARVPSGDAPEDQRQQPFFTDDGEESGGGQGAPVESGKPHPDGFRVVSSRFYFATLDRRPEPIIEIRVRNDLDRTIGKIAFCATLLSRDREAPLAEDFFGYEVEEGLKPGEEAEWHLQPDSDSAWGRAPRDLSKLTLNIVTIEVEDGSGKEILGWKGTDRGDGQSTDNESFPWAQTEPVQKKLFEGSR